MDFQTLTWVYLHAHTPIKTATVTHESHHMALSKQGKIGGLKEQLSLEVKYCAQLGSSSCNLLWSLSKSGIPHSTLNTVSSIKQISVTPVYIVNTYVIKLQ